MERREALRLLATGTALQLAPTNLLAALRGARRLLDTQVSPRTLNAHQFATVRTMAELILPRTETPGATDAGASEFIDLMLTEWYDERDRTRFANGLADVDDRTTALCGKNFVEASPALQAEILTALGESVAANADAGFYPMLRQLTLNAYYTSEAGATQELHYEVIPDAHDGCAPLPPAKGPEN